MGELPETSVEHRETLPGAILILCGPWMGTEARPGVVGGGLKWGQPGIGVTRQAEGTRSCAPAALA